MLPVTPTHSSSQPRLFGVVAVFVACVVFVLAVFVVFVVVCTPVC
jgi:hypothetical protein